MRFGQVILQGLSEVFRYIFSIQRHFNDKLNLLNKQY